MALPTPSAPQWPDSRTHLVDMKDTKSSRHSVNSTTTTINQIPDFPSHDLTELARQITRQSIKSHIEAKDEFENPFDADEGGPLDPFGKAFDPRLWTKSLLSMVQIPGRTAGFSFKNLSAYGFGSATDYQKNFGNLPLFGLQSLRNLISNNQQRIDIFQNMDGLVRAGEMLVVLGPPGSGCSTFLKTVSGETHGYFVDEKSEVNYEGISPKQMHNNFRGEAIYTAEVDVHFPMLSVGDTLSFASRARAPRVTPGGIDKRVFADHMRDVVMAITGISHTINTQVGSDLIRGVSGGERKRVTIAEALLSGAPLQCWDNSTRGLDSANAVEFVKTLKLGAELTRSTAAVAIYQAPQSAYDLFDKVTVLYEGRQIYFGPCSEAKDFFVNLGFYCPDRQTTADFLTSLTSDLERTVQPGWTKPTPRSPDEFVRTWKASENYQRLITEIEQYNQEFPISGPSRDKFAASRRAQQAKAQRASSPYTLSYVQQVELCLWRGFKRLVGQPELTITSLIGNSMMSLIIGSVFYNLKSDTASFTQRGSLLFFAILLSAFASGLEILLLYAQRPIVEKHQRYALYHPSAEAVASMLTDLPYKISNCILFSLTIYFMTDLRREPGHFFFFLLTSFCLTLTMSMLFRTIGASSRTLSQALAPAAVSILALVIYTGFVIPTRDMLGWGKWIHWLNPIAYGFESLMVNEFSGRNFPCSVFAPSGSGYAVISGTHHVCTSVGSVAGSAVVDGDAFINTAYQYYKAHQWRNIGIIIVEGFFFMCLYLLASEFVSSKKSKGEVLLFPRGRAPKELVGGIKKLDLENGIPLVSKRPTVDAGHAVSAIERQTSIFQWEDVTYDIKIRGEERRILDHVDGWVKPGTLTALMGVSGAGKTTLLDVLATRVTMGVVTGKMLVDGSQRDDSFQRKTGYVQQQDLHLATSTVREALTFSALLRQKASIPREEKLAYVDQVVKLLDMSEYVDAVVGVPGEGLNVEQRKRLTIGVELAAKPELLLFLDEPTSGLDSQTAWAICDLMAKLTAHGQAILCTIHQPSAMLFQRFDRLLFLAKGGRTIYFGEVGEGSHILTEYFESNGAFKIPEGANPAEWLLEVIGAAPGSSSTIDWHQTWLNSPERAGVKAELAEMESNGVSRTPAKVIEKVDKAAYREFAAPFSEQFVEVTKRVFQQYWRTPSYLYSKIVLSTASSLFIGLSFLNAKNSQQGLQNQLFGVFMLMTIFGNLVQQIMPHFVTQRALYEVRERPSKTFSWKAFMLANLLVELPWSSLCGFLIFITFYYPIGLYRNAEPTDAVHERGALFFLLVITFMLFTSTFSHFIVAGIESAETAGNIAQLLFSLCLIFCGTLAGPSVMPRFWIFMYRVSPFTYLVEGMLVTAIANTDVVCSSIELIKFDPTTGQTCGTYMADYISAAGGGYLVDPNATSACSFCQISSTNTFLKLISSDYANRWRDFGLMWVFIGFNIFAACFVYWLARVPKKPKAKKE